MQRFNQQRNICCKQPYGNSQQDNTEKLTDKIYTAFPEKTFHTPGHTHYKVDPNHIQNQGYNDIDTGIFRPKRKQSCKSSGTCQQRKDKRH